MSYSTPKRVAVLTRCDLIRAGLHVLLTDMGAEVISAAYAEALRRALRWRSNVDLLISDADQAAEALAVAREHKLPLLVIAPTVARGVAIASDEQVQAVVTLPVSQKVLADALATVMAGERYLPVETPRHLSGARLTEREQELVALDLQGIPAATSARWMRVETYTIYTYRSRIRKKLLKMSELPDWAVTWLRRFPGQ